MMTNNIVCNSYATELRMKGKEVYDRYMSKISVLGVDPYKIHNDATLLWSTNVQELPPINLIDIYDFCITQTSFYTKSELRAYKSLTAYDYFISGHVVDSKFLHLNSNILLISEVYNLEMKTPFHDFLN